jgi:hypothetical protein
VNLAFTSLRPSIGVVEDGLNIPASNQEPKYVIRIDKLGRSP